MKEDLAVIELRAKAQKADAYLVENGDYKILETGIDLLPYTTEEAGGFVGCTVGMYTSSNGRHSDNHCDFAWMTMDKI